MTAPAKVLEQARALGVRLSVNGDRLRYQGTPEAVQTILPALKEHKAELMAALLAANDPGARGYRWLVRQPSGESFEVCGLPEPCLAQLWARYPGAEITPLPEATTVRELPSGLEHLLARVAERYAWSAEDVALARAACARDPFGHQEMFVAWLAEPWPQAIKKVRHA